MPTEPQLSFDQPRSAFGTWLGIVLLFAIFGLVVWVVLNLMPRGDTYEEKRATARMEKLKTVQEEAAALHKYAWADKEKGVARIPIQRAMELTMAELAQKKPAPAGPIATPPPAPPVAATAAPAAAPSAAPQPPAVASPAAPVVPSPNESGAPPPVTPPSAPTATP